MAFRKTLSMFLAAICFCSTFSISSYAEEMSAYETEEIITEYAIARNPISVLAIDQGTASCTSSTNGGNCVQISVTQTLQKYSGWFWSWDNVAGACWSTTVNQNSVWLSNTKSGLSSGTYRLMSVFTLTNSSGQMETITIYSSEKTIN